MNTIYNLHYHKNGTEKAQTGETHDGRNRYQSLIAALHDYTASPLRLIQTSYNSLHALEFEKKICRAGFKKSFGHNLPNPGILEVSYGLYDVYPDVDSSRWQKKKSTRQKLGEYGEGLISYKQPQAIDKKLLLNTNLWFKDNNNISIYSAKRCSQSRGRVRGTGNRSFVRSGIQLMSSYWVLERCIEEIQKRRSARGVLNELIRDANVLFDYQHSACPVLGIRVTASGRLGKKKKGMAQQYTASTGKVPLGSFSQKVDYSQGFVSTKLGVIGLKVWVAFK